MSFKINSKIEIKKLDSNNFKNLNSKSIENSLKKEIYNLQEKIKELELENENNLLKISDLKKSRNMLLEKELINKRLTEELNAKQEIIEKLQLEMLKETKDRKEQNRLIENKYNNQLVYYKRLLETGLAKESAASAFLKLNENQHTYILQLEEKIEEIKKTYEEKIKNIKLDNENRYSKLKRQMMEFLKNSQKNMAKNNEENLELNSKLTVLYKNQMLNELENQSLQIEELLKERENYKKEIYVLNQELKIHKKVEEIIKGKNNKYLNIINKIKINLNQVQQKDNTKNNEKNNLDNERSNSVKIIKNNTNINLAGKTQNNFFQFKDNIKDIEQSKYCNSFKKVKSKKNEDNELENNIYNNLFKNIIKLCNQAIKKIIKDDKIIKINRNYLFSEDLDFKLLNRRQKSDFIIELMEKFLSFCKIDNESDLELLNINNNFNLIKKKYNNFLTDRVNPKSSNKQEIKYSKIFDIINKSKKEYNLDKKEFPNIKEKKIELFNKKIFKKKKNNTNFNSQLISSFRVNSPNPLIRYIHLSKDKNKEEKNNYTFYNPKK